MDALNETDIHTVVVMSSAQVGKTEILNNLIGYHIHQDPSPILCLQPTLDMAQTWSKDRLAPMLRDSPGLAERVRNPKSRDSKNTILHKAFFGGHITMAGANSAASLASRPIRIVALDEIDRYPLSAGTEGDPVMLAIKRAATFWNRRIIMTSTPTIKGASKIEDAFNNSDQRHYHVKCPHCADSRPLRWSGIHWDGEDPYTAHWACEECGGVVPDSDKAKFLKSGEWIAHSESHGVAGFHLNELYSPWRTWADVVIDFQRAKAVMEKGDFSLMQVWTNTSLGETWETVGQSVNPMGLYERREDWEHVPDGVSCITIGADVQDNRVEWEVVGWGADEESWSLDYQVRFGDLTKKEFWSMLARDMRKKYKRKDGYIFDPKMVCIDSAGHFTDEVYEFSRVHGVRHFIPIKGASIAGKPIADYPRKLNKKRVNLTMVGSDTAKDVIFSRLELQEKGPGYSHFPVSRDVEYFQQLTAEKKIMRYVKGFSRYEYVLPSGTRNEALDCRVYAFAAVRILQQYFGLRLEVPGKVEEKEPSTQKQSDSFITRPQGSWMRR